MSRLTKQMALLKFVFHRYAAYAMPTQQQLINAIEDFEKRGKKHA